MPKLPIFSVNELPGAALTVTQYKRMKRWADGKFDADSSGAEPVPTPLDKLPEKDRPQALDRAALEACVGGPYFPGIEASRVMLVSDETPMYDKQRPFRINATLPPGTLTAGMAVPWQADFMDCSYRDRPWPRLVARPASERGAALGESEISMTKWAPD